MGQPNIIFYEIKCNTCNTIIQLKMSTQSQYVKKWHQSALQDVVKDLVREKEGGWKNRTARDSYTTKIKSLELVFPLHVMPYIRGLNESLRKSQMNQRG
jgi:hypothetical protein